MGREEQAGQGRDLHPLVLPLLRGDRGRARRTAGALAYRIPGGGWFLLLVSAHAIVAAATSSYALSWALGRRARPVRLMAATAILTTVGSVAAMSQFPRDPNVGEAESAAYLLVTFAGFGIGALVIGLRRVRSMLLTVLAAMVVVGLAGLGYRLPIGALLGGWLGVLTAGLALTFTCGFSVWLVKSVWDLDSARELQTRLAVAEERLRFGRDMHDVMGRNLAVIALKSELAVQLVRRGGTEQAAEQMAEVQRIARESQREVRDVVRGYREVDLHTELEGARGCWRQRVSVSSCTWRGRRPLPGRPSREPVGCPG